MADHPFHGEWKSYVIRSNHEITGPFELNLNITPAGKFIAGNHNGNPLKCNHISTGQIWLQELGGDNGTLKAEVVWDLSEIKRKALAGTAVFPQGFTPGLEDVMAAPGQSDGVWVATLP